MGFFDRYPYTNWHNVNLDWVLERVKEWGQMVEANDQAFKDLEEANASFKEYVTNYLQDLDVQEAIDDKLDRMFEDGTLGEYLQPYVSPAVTTWLEENITEPEGVVIDSSLTVAGAAADAKATGDRLLNIASDTLNSTARNALLNMFRQIGYITQDARTVFDNLETQLLTDDIYDTWEWDSRFNGKGKLYRLPAGTGPININNVRYGIDYTGSQATQNHRRSFCINKGRQPFVNHDTGSLSNFYPVPIPKTAVKATITVYPVSQQVFTFLYKYSGYNGNGGYEYYFIGGSGSYIEGSSVINFEADSDLFLAFNMRRDSSNTPYTQATEPELHILFE